MRYIGNYFLVLLIYKEITGGARGNKKKSTYFLMARGYDVVEGVLVIVIFVIGGGGAHAPPPAKQGLKLTLS